MKMTYKTEAIIILDFRNVIANGSEEVISRHKEYAEILASQSNLKLHVHSRGFKTIEFLGKMSHSTSGGSTIGLIRYFNSLRAYIASNNLEPALLVVGDPWESLIAARIFRFIYFRQIPIQVQFHGDIASKGWKFLNIRNYLRYYFTFLSLGNMQNMYFRSTSNAQAALLEKTFKISKKNNSVLPVGLNLNPMISDEKVDSTNIRVAFVGRLHKDRGTQKFLEVLENLHTIFSNMDIFIIGDGPERDRLKSQITKHFSSLNVDFKGHLGNSELQHMWGHVDMLLSLAPFESYGRTIREALISGTPVLAQSSTGVLDLQEAISGKWLQLISDPIVEKELIDQVYFMKNVKIPEKFRKALGSECGKGNFDLVSRWIKIAKISESSKGAN